MKRPVMDRERFMRGVYILLIVGTFAMVIFTPYGVEAVWFFFGIIAGQFLKTVEET